MTVIRREDIAEAFEDIGELVSQAVKATRPSTC